MAIDKKLIQSVKEACHRLKAAGHDLGIEKLALGPVRRVVRQIRENVQDRRAARQGGRNQIQGQAAPTYPVAARRAAPTYPVAAPQAAASEPRMFDMAKSYANENESTVGSPRIGGGPANEVGPREPYDAEATAAEAAAAKAQFDSAPPIDWASLAAAAAARGQTTTPGMAVGPNQTQPAASRPLPSPIPDFGDGTFTRGPTGNPIGFNVPPPSPSPVLPTDIVRKPGVSVTGSRAGKLMSPAQFDAKGNSFTK